MYEKSLSLSQTALGFNFDFYSLCDPEYASLLFLNVRFP